MNKLYKVEDDIQKILEADIYSRQDDMYLYYKYCRGIFTFMDSSIFKKVFLDEQFRKEYNIRAFETISRVRRKIMRITPSLKPTKEIEKNRDNMTKEIVEYVTDYDENKFSKFLESVK